MNRKLPISVRVVFIFIFILFGFGQWSSPAYSAEQVPLVPCTGMIRIMPLGDSITRGSSSGVDDVTLQISYRKALYDSLVTSGYSIDFVGSLTNGENVPDFDPNHEGHAGWTDAQIAQNIYNNGGENWLGALGTNWPHIILLHIGTNVLDTSPADVETILNEIDEYENATNNHITVILARIIDMVPNSVPLHTFNNNVQAMAEARTADDIVIVDMEDGAGLNYALQPAGDFFDGLHPYTTGYTKMAAVWKTALDQVFLDCNSQPEITNPGDQTSDEGSSPTLQIVASDQDTGQTLTYSAQNLPPDLTINSSTGEISGIINYEAATGSPYQVIVKVEDDGVPSRFAEATFDWTITNINRAPNAIDDNLSTDEDIYLDFTVASLLANDSDEDGTTPILTGIDTASLAGGTITDLGSGNYRYSPPDNFFGSDSFTYTISDGEATDSATVTIDVANINDEPVAKGQALTTDEDIPLSVTLIGEDPDATDILSYSIVDPPANGTLSGDAPNLTYTPDQNYFGVDTFTFKVNDGTVDSNQATVKITVNPVNDLEVTNPGNQNSQEGDSVSLRIDVLDAEGDPLNFTMSGAPPELSIDENTGRISGKVSLSAAQGSPYQVTVTVSDGIDSIPVVFSWTIGDLPSLYLPMVTR
jgi:hypothetical protein